MSPLPWSKEGRLFQKHNRFLKRIKEGIEKESNPLSECNHFRENASRYIKLMNQILSKTDGMGEEEKQETGKVYQKK